MDRLDERIAFSVKSYKIFNALSHGRVRALIINFKDGKGTIVSISDDRRHDKHLWLNCGHVDIPPIK
ncbi:hypothetical protein ACLBSJ_31730 [Klebsiella pneumoniae]|uniref:hypothetical protein n=1 Tax=Klebsiella pneumoniae TaxID=573 RepID=UPI003968F91E